MTNGTGLSEFAEKFPNRIFDVGIAEEHAVTFAAGLVTEGIKPYVAIYSTFTQRAFDQLIHDVALQNLPIVLCLDRAGLVGDDGATHHGVFDLSYLNLIPNWQVWAPSNAEELEMMLEKAENYSDGPVAIRYPRGKAIRATRKIAPFEPGKFEIVETGEKVAFIGIGKNFGQAEYCYNEFIKNHKSAYLINARTLKPFDTETLDTLNVEKVFTFEDNTIIGGFGSSVKNYYADKTNWRKMLQFISGQVVDFEEEYRNCLKVISDFHHLVE